jgi:uncharacterized membrane protein
MVDVHHVCVCEAPIQVTFAYLDDYRTATQWMFGLKAMEPVGQRDQGMGAIFDATFQVKLIKLHSTIQVVAWEQDALLAFKSIQGFDNESTWRFTSLGPTTTRVSVTLSYTLPGGLAGRAVGRALEPIIAFSAKHIDAALRENVEVPYAQRH